MKKNGKLMILFLCTAIVLAGCGSSGSSSASRTGSSGGGADPAMWTEVDNSIEETVASEEYREATEEQKASILLQDLQQQYEAGKLADEPVYDSGEALITYTYSDGTLGGISMAEMGDAVDGAYARAGAEAFAENSGLGKVDLTSLRVTVMDGFENTDFRRSFYENLDREWKQLGLLVETDFDTTVNELKGLGGYDVIVLAMHGGMYRNHPILSPDEAVTDAKDREYRSELSNRYIARVYCADKRFHYWILPDFFRAFYDSGDLEGSVIFAQCCDFFGCDCMSSATDNTMAATFMDAGAAVVIGYHNSVESVYSRSVMKETLEQMYGGAAAAEAVSDATDVYGKNDRLEDPKQDKYLAYPIVYGAGNSAFPKEEPAVPEEPAASVPDEETLLGMYYEAFQAGAYNYYAFAMLDEDDLPELIVANGLSPMSEGMYADTVEIYTIRNGSVVDAGWVSNSFSLIRYDSASRTLKASWGGAGVNQNYTAKVQGEQVVYSYLTFDMDHNTYDLDGVTLSASEYQSRLMEWEQGEELEFKAY